MLCLYLFIHSNYCLSYNYGQESPSETSSEENLADFYGRSDEYLNESGKLWCFCYFICHYIIDPAYNIFILVFLLKHVLFAKSRERKQRTAIDNWDLLETRSALIHIVIVDIFLRIRHFIIA